MWIKMGRATAWSFFIVVVLIYMVSYSCLSQSACYIQADKPNHTFINASGNVDYCSVNNYESFIFSHGSEPLTASEMEMIRKTYPDTPPIDFLELPRYQQADIVKVHVEYYIIAVTAVLLVLIGYMLLALYKSSKKPVLDSPERAEVFKHIRDNPGITKVEMAGRLGMNYGTLRYHIDVLEKARLITVVKIGKYLRMFQSHGKYDDREKRLISIMKTGNNCKIVQIVLENPGIGTTAVSEKIDISKSATSVYLNQLVEEGILVNKKSSGANRYYLNSELVDQVIRSLDY